MRLEVLVRPDGSLKATGDVPLDVSTFNSTRSRCKNSMGSSIVTMCLGTVRLIRSNIEASVVDLPLPVVPVTRVMPRS